MRKTQPCFAMAGDYACRDRISSKRKDMEMRGKLRTIFCLLTILFVVFILSPCAYSDDHGDDCASATSVSCNSTTSGDIETEGDWDYFRIDLTEYGSLTIYSTGDEDFYGYLYDSGCTVITEDDDSGSGYNFHIVWTLTTGTYYVAVKHTGYLGTTGPYTLHVEFVCSDPSSVPLSAVKRAAPPLIMFVLDDSGTMDWEFMTEEDLTEEDCGKFQGYEYVFDNPGDNVFSGDILSGTGRLKWKSQWSGYNKLYYDPTVTYEPWPTLNDAHPDTPRSHPINTTPTFSLNDTYYPIIVDNLDGAPSYVENPAWGGESLYEPEYAGSGRWTDIVGSTATFTPDLLVADTYEVYAWWNCWTERDTNVKITVTHQGGSDVIYRNQSADVDDVPVCYGPPASPCCGQWILIGTYSFAAGTAGSVTIERHAASTGSSTVADAVKFVPTLDIKNAHYYAFDDTNDNGDYDSGEPVYLVVIEGTGGAYTMRYYQATITGSGATEEVTDLLEVAEASVPESVKSSRTAAEERQNFANWYSFYRRRHFAATAAVANTIDSMEGVKIGLYSINSIYGERLIQPVLPVKAEGLDSTATLLNNLYSMTLTGDT